MRERERERESLQFVLVFPFCSFIVHLFLSLLFLFSIQTVHEYPMRELSSERDEGRVGGRWILSDRANAPEEEDLFEGKKDSRTLSVSS